MKIRLIIILIAAHLGTASSYSQTENNRDAQLTEIAETIEKHYIFEKVGVDVAKRLKEEIENESFNGLSDREFADSISSFLRKVGNDEHFNLLYLAESKGNEMTPKEFLNFYDSINELMNYGFDKVERLEGNIGYIKYSGFHEKYKPACDILAASMNFLKHTDALIIDLRYNFGGSGQMVEAFLSYFFEKKQKLSTIYTRYTDETITSKTKKKVIGEKYLDKPVYILVNNLTVSAAEALAYNLQQYGKAIVIGEHTLGAANPVEFFFVDGNFQLFIPVSEERNEISKSNWEHKGVDIDVKIDEAKALTKAHVLALEDLMKSGSPAGMSAKSANDFLTSLKQALSE